MTCNVILKDKEEALDENVKNRYTYEEEIEFNYSDTGFVENHFF